MSFASLLIHTATIQAKHRETTGYEQVDEWTDVADDVPCRKDDSPSAKIQDSNIRVNIDDALFFFLPDANVIRGNRILMDGDLYDVVKVNKLYARGTSPHHLEVIAHLVDNA